MLRNSRIELSRLMLGWFATIRRSPSNSPTPAKPNLPTARPTSSTRDADGFNARLFIDRETRLPLMVTYRGPQPRVVTAGGPIRQAPPAARGTRWRAGGARAPGDDRRGTQKARDDAEKQIEALRSQPQATVEFTLFFDDWRDVGGIKFPHKLRRAMSGDTNEVDHRQGEGQPEDRFRRSSKAEGSAERDSSSNRAGLGLPHRALRWCGRSGPGRQTSASS